MLDLVSIPPAPEWVDGSSRLVVGSTESQTWAAGYDSAGMAGLGRSTRTRTDNGRRLVRGLRCPGGELLVVAANELDGRCVTSLVLHSVRPWLCGGN